MKMMGRSCHGDERWEEEEEEEALSLCDLPVKEKQQPIRSASAAVETEEFDFKQWQPAAPMLAADELFFQGQMLPLRVSFSCENSESNNINQLFGGNLWNRSESMDHNMMRFRNGSSSSSSSRSHYSRSSSHSNNSISNPTNSKPRPQKNNVFHSHPSPTPQIRSFSTSSHRSRSSSRWEFFRLGLLRTPGMELHDLKTRTTTTAAAVTTAHKPTASILGVVSCKKSVDTVPATTKNIRSENVLKNNKNKNNKKVEIREKEKEKEKERRVSHRRTFEWLKQLSHATFGEE